MSSSVIRILIAPVGFIVFLLLLFPVRLEAQQHYVGVRGGAVAGKARIKPTVESKYFMPTPVAGISYKYYGTDRFLGGIQIDLNVLQKGFKTIPESSKPDTSYRRTITAIELPFLWQPHANLFHGHARVFLNLGPYVSYSLSSKEEMVSARDGVLWKGDYVYDSRRDNRLEIGLAGGGGLAIAIRRFELQAEFRYVFGFSDMLKQPMKYPGNPDSSPIDQMNISLGLYYQLFKQKKEK